MKNHLYSISFILILLSCLAFTKFNKNYTGYKPKNGFVPDEITAKKIAEAIWIPIYGKDIIKYKPYFAKLQGDTLWIVEGSLSKNSLGGVPYIQILKSDCRILNVSHSK